jgi:hypothetical protein
MSNGLTDDGPVDVETSRFAPATPSETSRFAPATPSADPLVHASTPNLVAPLLPGLPAHTLDHKNLTAAISYVVKLKAEGNLIKAAETLQRRRLFPKADPATQTALVEEFIQAALEYRARRLAQTVAKMEFEHANDPETILAEAREDFENTEASIEARAAQWPETAVVEIVKTVRNPKLVVVRLEDGREASMWRVGHWPIGARTKVRIETRLPEPIYEPVREDVTASEVV